MKRKQICSLITAALVATSLVVMPGNVTVAQAKEKSSVTAASIDDLTCEYQAQITQNKSNSVTGNIFVENTSGHDIDLSKVTLNYYYSNPENLKEEFHCYYSGTQGGSTYYGYTDKIRAEFKDTGDSDSTKSRTCEMTFSDGILPAGSKMVVQMSFNVQGWSGNFDQSDDFSFINNSVEIKYDGEGHNGGEQKQPVVDMNASSYTVGSGSQVKATVANAKLQGIRDNSKSLVEGRDYSYNASTGNVIFTRTYLDSLTSDQTLTFVFPGNKVVTKELSVIVGQQQQLTLTVGDMEAEEGSEVLVPVTLSGFKYDDAIENYEFVVNYDSSKLELVGAEGAGLTAGNTKLFEIKDKKSGSARVQYLTEKAKQTISKDGVIGNLKFKVKGKAGEKAKVSLSNINLSYYNSKAQNVASYKSIAKSGVVTIIDGGNHEALNLNVGEVKGDKGTIVSVPVDLSGFKYDDAIENYEFVVKYDASKVELVGVEGAGLTAGNNKLFEIKDKKAGSARIQYLTEKAKQTISKDGTICNLQFKLIGNEGEQSDVSLSNVSLSYFNSKTQDVANYKANVKNGSIEINEGQTTLNVDIEDNVKGVEGKQVSVPVNLNGFAGKAAIENYEFVINYDSSELELVGVEGAGLTAGNNKLFEIKDKKAGSARIQYLTEKAKQTISKDGTICNLVFNVKGKAGDSTDINIKNVVLSYFNDVTGDAANYKANGVKGSVDIIKDNDNDDDDDDKVTLTVDVEDKVKANKGEEVSVPVYLSDFKDGLTAIENYEFVMKYDSTKLEFVGVEGAGQTAKYQKLFEVKDQTSSSARIQYLTEKAKQTVSKDGQICTLKFKVKDDTEAGEAKIDLSNVVLSYFDEAKGDAANYNVNAKAGSVDVQGGGEVETDLGVIIDNVTAAAGDTVKIPVKVKIDPKSAATGAQVRIKDTENYTCVDTIDNDDELEEAGASTTFCDYIASTKSAKMYVVFDKGSFDGEYVLGTVEVKLNSNLAAGTKVKLDVADVVFGTSEGKALKYNMNIGEITIKGETKTEQKENKDLGVVIDSITASAGETVDVPVKVKISNKTAATGAQVRIKDTENYTCVDTIDNDDELEEAGASTTFCDYIKSSKSAKMYVVFDKGSFNGEYVLGTVQVKLKSNLASGTRVKLDVQDVVFGTSEGKALEYGLNVGDIVIK